MFITTIPYNNENQPQYKLKIIRSCCKINENTGVPNDRNNRCFGSEQYV